MGGTVERRPGTSPAILELRTPLTVIRARAQLALRRLADETPDAGTATNDLAEIAAAVDRLAAMLDRLERGETDLRPQP